MRTHLPDPRPPAVFTFEDAFDLRIVDEAGDPWFVAADVAKLLGYAEAKDLTRTLDEDEKGRHTLPTLGGDQQLLVVSEAGLWHGVLQRKSDKRLPEDVLERIARVQRWVFHDVLPSIRRTGSYELASPAMPEVSQLRDVDVAFRLCRSIARTAEVEGNAATIAAAQATYRITGTNPLQLLGITHFKADVQEHLLTATQIGHKFGLSPVAMNLRLRALGYQAPLLNSRGRHEKWEPTDKGRPFGSMALTGKKHNDGTPITQWRWYGSIINEIADRMVPAESGDVA